jgi:hypothetical protein
MGVDRKILGRMPQPSPLADRRPLESRRGRGGEEARRRSSHGWKGHQPPPYAEHRSERWRECRARLGRLSTAPGRGTRHGAGRPGGVASKCCTSGGAHSAPCSDGAQSTTSGSDGIHSLRRCSAARASWTALRTIEERIRLRGANPDPPSGRLASRILPQVGEDLVVLGDHGTRAPRPAARDPCARWRRDRSPGLVRVQDCHRRSCAELIKRVAFWPGANLVVQRQDVQRGLACRAAAEGH